MLGDFITRILVLLLGYAYPAFECYKTVERNKIDIEKLRFWCQYWILVALLTSFERVGDIFISWLPMYGEMKVLFFIYLWHPKTKGTGYVYQTLLRPYIAEHETDIDRKIMEMRARVWDFFILHWQKCAKMGHSTLLQAFQYVVAQSVSISNPANQQKSSGVSQPRSVTRAAEEESPAEPQPEPVRINKPLSAIRSMEKQSSRGKKWPPPTPPPTPSRGTTDSPKSNGNFSPRTEDSSVSIPDTLPESPITDARARLRRLKPTA